MAVSDGPWPADVYLEVQEPWASMLLDGIKTVETRAYALPPELLHQRVHILCSKEGTPGRSALGDVVEAGTAGVSVAGSVVFTSAEPYASRGAWAADTARHCVDPSHAAYGWPTDGKCVYGWVVGSVSPADDPQPPSTPLRRRLRSLFVPADA